MRRAQRHNDFKNGVGGVTKRSCYRGPNDRTMHPTRAPARRRRNPYNTCHVATPMIIIDITIAATSQHWVRLLLSLVLALVLVLVFVFVVCTCIFTRTCTTRGVRVRPRSARLAPIPRRPRGQAGAARQFFDPDGLAPYVNDSKPTAVHTRCCLGTRNSTHLEIQAATAVTCASGMRALPRMTNICRAST